MTGLGAVTPIGVGVNAFWEGLKAGRSGIGRVTHFDASEFRCKLAAEVSDFDSREWIDKKSAGRMDRFTQFAVAASDMAFKDSGLDSFSFDGTRAGVIIGSGIGGSQTLDDGHSTLSDAGPGKLGPFFVSRVLVNMAACTVSIRFGLKGPLSAPSVACSTGSNAIGDAFRIIQRGDADIMFAGSSEACITPLAYGGFCATRAMTQNDCPEKASKPFDKRRNGFIMGEGCGIAVLESAEHAAERNARVYAEVAGYGNAADAHHLMAPEAEGEGMSRVMRKALADSGLKTHEIEYINAHGTSTVLNDKCESKAIMNVFGDNAGSMKVSSIKSMIGHLMAAAGSVEFVSTVMSVHEGAVPPTINYEEPDPDCSLDYVTNGVESVNINAAMSNSFGFGGGNACLIVRKYGETIGNS